MGASLRLMKLGPGQRGTAASEEAVAAAGNVNLGDTRRSGASLHEIDRGLHLFSFGQKWMNPAKSKLPLS